MISKYDLLYPIDPAKFELYRVRFEKKNPAGVLKCCLNTSLNGDNAQESATALIQHIDQLCISEFYSPVDYCPTDHISHDLNLEETVKHLLRPRFTPGFQKAVLEKLPIDLETSLYRQEGIRELIEKPEIAKGLENSLEAFMKVVYSVLDRAYVLHELQRRYDLRWRTKLKILTPCNLKILQNYVKAVQSFTETLETVESKPLKNLKQYIQEIRESDFFKDVFPVFSIGYYKDYRLNLDVTITRQGTFSASEYKESFKGSHVPGFRLISKNAGKLYAFFRMLSLPTTVAMDATNITIENNLTNVIQMTEIVGPLEFYTSGAFFYRRMKERGMPVQLPKLLPKEARKLHIPQARNALLLYQKEISGDVNQIIPNDIGYNPNQNIMLITGPNQGGKTCYVKTVGLETIFGLSGLPITAEGKAEISVVDGIHTHFVSADDIIAGEGRYLNELKRVREIFQQATPYSLVILDEPCGGTEHAEGVNESRVILNGLHRLGTATYFTTHLHELAEAVEKGAYACAHNLHVEIKEDEETHQKIRTFKVLPGRATSSYGTEIAKKAGVTMEEVYGLLESRCLTGGLDQSKLRK